jgi:hypothetical protein
VPSRISRTISSSPSGRFDQASQSVFTFRQMRLTASLPTAPLEQRRQRPAHPPGIGAGEIGPGDQRLHLASVMRAPAPPIRARGTAILTVPKEAVIRRWR